MSMRCWWFQDAMGIGFKAGAQPCEMLIFFYQNFLLQCTTVHLSMLNHH